MSCIGVFAIDKNFSFKNLNDIFSDDKEVKETFGATRRDTRHNVETSLGLCL